jgi:hypothetical protein
MEAAKGDLQEALSAYYERQQSRITSVHDNRPEELYAGGKNSYCYLSVVELQFKVDLIHLMM